MFFSFFLTKPKIEAQKKSFKSDLVISVSHLTTTDEAVAYERLEFSLYILNFVFLFFYTIASNSIIVRLSNMMPFSHTLWSCSVWNHPAKMPWNTKCQPLRILFLGAKAMHEHCKNQQTHGPVIVQHKCACDILACWDCWVVAGVKWSRLFATIQYQPVAYFSMKLSLFSRLSHRGKKGRQK